MLFGTKSNMDYTLWEMKLEMKSKIEKGKKAGLKRRAMTVGLRGECD
jgi:hypothetical protein